MDLSNAQPVEDYLKGGIYTIPKYQRSYSWTSEAEDLWIDLVSLADDIKKYGKEKPKHFFGQIVIHNDEINTENEKHYIVDGQQRTVTSIILLAAIRDHAKRFTQIQGDANLQRDAMIVYSNISNDLIGGSSPYGDDEPLKFTFGNAAVQDYFSKNIQMNEPEDKISNLLSIPPKTRLPEKCIINVYSYFYSRLQEKLDESIGNPKEAFQILKQYLFAFTRKFLLICLNTSDLADAYDIFESLNARGKDLDTSDLLKNYMFKTVDKSKQDFAEEQWNGIVNKLPNTALSTYIKCYWNSFNTFCREQGLYRNLSRYLDKNQTLCLNFISNLNKEADVYAELSNPGIYPKFFNKKEEAKLFRIIYGLKKLKVSLYYPIMLALVRKNYDAKSMTEVMESVESLVFRNIVVADKKSNVFEKPFAEAAVKISKSKEKLSVSEITSNFSKYALSDEEFKIAFKSLDLYPKSNSNTLEVVRYIIRNINSFMLGKEVTVETNNSINHIEHIMPEKADKWEHISKEDHEKYLWNIGNLSLLEYGLNIPASNNPFEDKLPYYKKSVLWTNTMLCNSELFPEWNVETILKREEILVDISTKVWPIK